MRTTLITGANRGIGLEFSRQYAANGWRVMACCRHPSDALSELSNRYPERISLHELDVDDHAGIEQLSRNLAHISIDLLINNAGIYPDSDSDGFGHTDYADWMLAFRINTMAPLKMAEAFATQIASSTRKTIATLTSKMGSIADNGGGGNYIYRSSKVAGNMVAKNLAIDLKATGIISVALHPGWVKTDMGGSNAMISVESSVTGMLRVIDGLTLADSGKFIAFNGQVIPW